MVNTITLGLKVHVLRTSHSTTLKILKVRKRCGRSWQLNLDRSVLSHEGLQRLIRNSFQLAGVSIVAVIVVDERLFTQILLLAGVTYYLRFSSMPSASGLYEPFVSCANAFDH